MPRFPTLARTLLLVLFALAPPGIAADDASSRAAQLTRLYADYWEQNLRLNPLQATQVGDKRYNDRLPNTLAPQHRKALKAFHAKWLARATRIGPEGLSESDRLSYDLFTYGRERDLEGLAFPSDLVPLNQFYNLANAFATLGSGTTSQPFRTRKDYDDWLRRARQIPVLFDQAIANMREGVRQGVVQPKVLMEKVLPQLDQQIVAQVEDSTYWGPIRNLPKAFSGRDRERYTRAYAELIRDTLVPAYRKLRTFVAEEYLPNCRDTVGLRAQPDGAAWYAYLVRRNTTMARTPAEIHAIGLAEVERLHGEMRKVMAEVGFTGTLQEFFAKVKRDPAQQFASEDDLLSSYRAFRAEVEPKLGRLFDIRPRADFEIRPVEPFRAASSSSGQYSGPPEDGSRPGIFYVNTYDLPARKRYAMESLYLHEATPGHHFQIALQRELTDLPRFRRFEGETAFSEGWGLYSESLGKELGVFRDPYAWFGALAAELWRSIRLVADTGLHDQGWTRQQVLEYMRENSAAEETIAVSETERFIAIPGQALAYKMGQLKIRELRTNAEAALGATFDVKRFHTEVLKDGSLPMNVLEAKIGRWIDAERSRSAAR